MTVKGIIGYEGERNIFEAYARLLTAGRMNYSRTQIPRSQILQTQTPNAGWQSKDGLFSRYFEIGSGPCAGCRRVFRLPVPAFIQQLFR